MSFRNNLHNSNLLTVPFMPHVTPYHSHSSPSDNQFTEDLKTGPHSCAKSARIYLWFRLESERSSCIGSSCNNQSSATFRLSFSGSALNFSPLQRTFVSISFIIRVSYGIDVVRVEAVVDVVRVEAVVDVAGVEAVVDVAGNEVDVVVVTGGRGLSTKYNDTPTVMARQAIRSKPRQTLFSLKVAETFLFSGC